MQEFEILKQKLPGVRANVPLANHTTFRIGGPAKYFFVAKTAEDTEKATRAAGELGLRFFLLAGGSNVLVADKGFGGLVIKMQNAGYQITKTRVRAEAGVAVATLVRQTGQRGLSGFEWAGGLPGTIGGAVRGNAGAFGGEIKDIVASVTALDEKGSKKVFAKEQCQFGYRNSLFKQKGYVVLSAEFLLSRAQKKDIQAVAKEHVSYRRERHPLEYPNAGSVFKNCDVQAVPPSVREEFAEAIKHDPFPVIPTAAILAKAGLGGMRVGGAQVSQKHPNYIVNRGNATCEDVRLLIEKIKKQIQRKFHVALEEEVQYIS